MADLIDEIEIDSSIPIVFPFLVTNQRIALQINDLQISNIA